jgi:hypothetical protein
MAFSCHFCISIGTMPQNVRGVEVVKVVLGK